VAISWCFPGDPTENTPYIRWILEALTVHDAIVPELWAFEVANNIFVSHSRRKRINEQQVAEYLELLQALPIQVESQSLWANVGLEALARRWDMAAYDAAYLELALRKGLPLATTDGVLKEKAKAAGVLIFA
jgi:predicted nucleic acid-binding protein